MDRALTTSAAAPSAATSVLRRALLLDAVASGAMGTALALAAGPLGDRFDLSPTLLRGVGVALLPYAAFLAYLAERRHPARPAVLAVIGGNIAWAVASLALLLVAGVDPSALGYAFVVAQALAVALFAALQSAGLRKAAPMLS